MTDRTLLISQQQSETTLATMRELANEHKRGYTYHDKLLICTGKSDADTPIKQFVLLQPCRVLALKLAHGSDLVGHCGVKLPFVAGPPQTDGKTGHASWELELYTVMCQVLFITYGHVLIISFMVAAADWLQVTFR